MQDKLEALKETLENHISQLKTELVKVEEEKESLETKITYTEGRVFELAEIIDYMNKSQEVTNGSEGQRNDAGASGAGEEV
jgi:phage shock protein A